ncbi:MAG TPA: 3-dehydroquinate synthase [Ignavibacteriales bacterium]|nr:3-dehydroquinate synthase [Ignavibacteriales bacterium]
MTKKINVKLSDKSHQIIIGNDALQNAVEKINSLNLSKCLLVIDKNVIKHHSMLIRKTFALLNCKTFSYILNANEKNKSLTETGKIYKFLIDNYFDRNSIIIAIGGGITGDLAGFAASTFLRGIQFIQIPTTLLSMVDSSVGGKTGINFNSKKNMVGTFYQPEMVVVYPEFLSTLPKRELYSGAGEIFKYAFLTDFNNYYFLKNNLKKLFSSSAISIEKTIYTCLKIKVGIVENDEKEISGLRKILNLGHTFAHAFEAESNYKINHGQAVIGGIFCSLFLSQILGYMQMERLNKFLNDFNFIKLNPGLKSINSGSVFNLMSSDKKSISCQKRFVLLVDVGNIITDVKASKAHVIYAIEKMKEII